MLGLIVLVAAAMFGLSCADILGSFFGYALTCDQPGAMQLVWMVILVAISNQTAYRLTPQSAVVREIKAVQRGEADLSLGRG